LLKSPFFRRLFLPYLLLICAAVGVVGVLAAQRLRDSYLERTHQMLLDNTLLVGQLIADNLSRDDAFRLNGQIKRLGQAIGCRITVVRTDGTVAADNEANPADMENHRLRPEIIAADSTGAGSSRRHSATLDQGMMYLARRIDIDGQPPFFLRLALPLDALDHHLNALYAGLAAAALLAMGGAGVISYFIARRHAAPLVRLTQFADGLARGRLDRRIMKSDAGEIGTLADVLNSMADSLGRHIAETARNHAELLAILTSMSEGVIATDMNQRIILVNGSAGDMLGFERPKARGRFLWEVVRDPVITQAADAVFTTMTNLDANATSTPDASTTANQGMTLQVGPLEGRYLQVSLRTFWEGKTPQGLVIVCHDVTQSMRYQELRKQFVANVSHELRTPLTAIKGFSETLRTGAILDAVKGPQYLSIIEKHADQLTNLVNDLLELSRLESHSDLPRRARVDMKATTARAVQMLLPAAQKKGQTLELDAAKGLPEVAGDEDYLERAVANLVENAIKYTPSGGAISVLVKSVANQLTVAVQDNGIGIPPGDLPRIFERFYRVDRSRSREMGGTGLGLSIVKHIAQAHRGGVEVASTQGQGSCFILKLPVADSPPS